MDKNKIFPKELKELEELSIKNFTLLKEFSSMSQSIFTIYNSDSMFLLTVYFFKVCPGCTSPCNVPVVNIGIYVRMIQ